MLENTKALASLFKLLIDGFKSINLHFNKKKKLALHRKIIMTQIILENIIDTAEQIFTFVDPYVNSSKTLDKNSKKELNELVTSQSNNIRELISIFHDDMTNYILKLFAPDLSKKICDYLYRKDSRIIELAWYTRNFNSKNLKAFYNEDDMNISPVAKHRL